MPAPQANSSLNATQQRIRDLLAAAARPLSAYDIIDALRGQTRLAPPTVYRALDKLIEAGLAHRLETRNAYVACRQGAHACGHGAGFMICRACGTAQDCGDEAIEALLGQTAARTGFSAERVAIEIQGLCSECLGA